MSAQAVRHRRNAPLPRLRTAPPSKLDASVPERLQLLLIKAFATPGDKDAAFYQDIMAATVELRVNKFWRKSKSMQSHAENAVPNICYLSLRAALTATRTPWVDLKAIEAMADACRKPLSPHCGILLLAMQTTREYHHVPRLADWVLSNLNRFPAKKAKAGELLGLWRDFLHTISGYGSLPQTDAMQEFLEATCDPQGLHARLATTEVGLLTRISSIPADQLAATWLHLAGVLNPANPRMSTDFRALRDVSTNIWGYLILDITGYAKWLLQQPPLDLITAFHSASHNNRNNTPTSDQMGRLLQLWAAVTDQLTPSQAQGLLSAWCQTCYKCVDVTNLFRAGAVVTPQDWLHLRHYHTARTQAQFVTTTLHQGMPTPIKLIAEVLGHQEASREHLDLLQTCVRSGINFDTKVGRSPKSTLLAAIPLGIRPIFDAWATEFRKHRLTTEDPPYQPMEITLDLV